MYFVLSVNEAYGNSSWRSRNGKGRPVSVWTRGMDSDTRVSPMFNKRQGGSTRVNRAAVASLAANLLPRFIITLVCFVRASFFSFFFLFPFSLSISLSLSRFEFRSRNFSQLKSSSHAKQHGNGTFAIRASRFEKKKTKNRRIHSVVYFQHGMTR